MKWTDAEDIGIALVECPPAKREMRLLGGAMLDGKGVRRIDGLGALGRLARVDRLEERPDAREYVVVLQSAGGGDHDVGRPVVLAE